MAEKKLYTLTELAKRADVSMPTLQRYKKLYQDRIPSVGEGRRQRYPKEAIAEIRKIKQENLKKRGRAAATAKPAKKKAQKAKKAKKAKTAKQARKTRKARKAKTKGRAKQAAKRRSTSRARSGGKVAELLTLTEIGRRTGISYPTLVRYTKLYIDQIPHVGSGRKRRYPEAAVEVFAELRKNSKRGRPKSKAKRTGRGGGRVGSAVDPNLARRIRELERVQTALSKQLSSVIALLKKPVQVTIRPE